MRKTCFILMLAAVLCGCADKKGHEPEKEPQGGGKDPDVIATAVIKVKGNSTPVDLKENSTITFADGYMVVKSSGKETRVALKDVSTLSYQ